MNTVRIYIAAIGAFALIANTQAAVLISDSFTGYTAGNIIGQAANGTGLTGNWALSGNTGTYTVDANSLLLTREFTAVGGVTASSTADTGTPVTGDKVYIGFDLTVVQGSGDGTLDALGSVTFNNALSMGVTNAGAFAIAGISGGSYSAGTTYRLVAEVNIRLDGVSEDVRLWVNPTAITDITVASGTANLAFNSWNGTLPTVAFTVTNATNNSARFDNFIVSTTFAETAIPEPGTLALVGLALGSLLLFRRR